MQSKGTRRLTVNDTVEIYFYHKEEESSDEEEVVTRRAKGRKKPKVTPEMEAEQKRITLENK